MLLTIDHIDNDGGKHRREIKSLYIYPWIKKNNFPAGFQVLCFSCNHGKQLNGGTRCPAWEDHDVMKHWRDLRRHMQEHPHDHPSNTYGSGQTSPMIPGLRAFNAGEQVIPVVSPHPHVLPTSISIKHHPGSSRPS